VKRIVSIILIFAGSALFAGDDFDAKRKAIEEKYSTQKPVQFGMYLPGVKTHIKTDRKIIALTFDGCGGRGGKGFDRDLINYLSANKIPATLFVTTSWIGYNEAVFKELLKNPNFDIQNHGFNHRPGTVNGQTVWGIRGTASAGECYDEFEKSARAFEKIAGRRPFLYRSGTAYFDEVGIRILKETGQTPMNFSGVIGDADKALSLATVEKFIRQNVHPGAVLIMHFNHPGGKTFIAVKDMIPEIKKAGYEFVKLTDYRDSLE
jgi:peptidoglycan/xylan/chitin deacetylase (PgdA/CDA1 family)